MSIKHKNKQGESSKNTLDLSKYEEQDSNFKTRKTKQYLGLVYMRSQGRFAKI